MFNLEIDCAQNRSKVLTHFANACALRTWETLSRNYYNGIVFNTQLMIHPCLSKNPFLLLQHLAFMVSIARERTLIPTHQSDSLARSGRVAVGAGGGLGASPVQPYLCPSPSCCLSGVRVSAGLSQQDSLPRLQARQKDQWGCQLKIGIQVWKTALCPKTRQSMRIAAWRGPWIVKRVPAETIPWRDG
jgi:hypothetical protein